MNRISGLLFRPERYAQTRHCVREKKGGPVRDSEEPDGLHMKRPTYREKRKRCVYPTLSFQKAIGKEIDGRPTMYLTNEDTIAESDTYDF